MRIDHVIYGVRDLDDAAVRLERRYGLRFLPAGRHPGGTVNRVAWLEPPQYLELLAVEHVGDDLTREVEELLIAGRTLLGWGIEVDDIDAVARRLGREIVEGSGTNADGSTGGWRLVLSEDLSLPFFIAYDSDPGAGPPQPEQDVRDAGAPGFGGFTFVELGGDPILIRQWLGDTDLPVRFAPGRAGLHRVGIAGPTGEIVLEDTA